MLHWDHETSGIKWNDCDINAWSKHEKCAKNVYILIQSQTDSLINKMRSKMKNTSITNPCNFTTSKALINLIKAYTLSDCMAILYQAFQYMCAGIRAHFIRIVIIVVCGVDPSPFSVLSRMLYSTARAPQNKNSFHDYSFVASI